MDEMDIQGLENRIKKLEKTVYWFNGGIILLALIVLIPDLIYMVSGVPPIKTSELKVISADRRTNAYIGYHDNGDYGLWIYGPEGTVDAWPKIFLGMKKGEEPVFSMIDRDGESIFEQK